MMMCAGRQALASVNGVLLSVLSSVLLFVDELQAAAGDQQQEADDDETERPHGRAIFSSTTAKCARPSHIPSK